MTPKCISCGQEMRLEDKDRNGRIVSSFWICDSCNFYLYIDFNMDTKDRKIEGEIECPKER